MKQIFIIILVVIGFTSCNTDNDTDFHYELLPVESVTLPAEFKRDSIYEIPFQYIRPSSCHAINGFYYDKESNIRTVAIETIVFEQNNCTTAPINPLTVILNFKPTVENSYVFKLWKGKDANGQDIFEEIEIPVIP